jgi:hypothetical protein
LSKTGGAQHGFDDGPQSVSRGSVHVELGVVGTDEPPSNSPTRRQAVRCTIMPLRAAFRCSEQPTSRHARAESRYFTIDGYNGARAARMAKALRRLLEGNTAPGDEAVAVTFTTPPNG